jgi:hypothetical protein
MTTSEVVLSIVVLRLAALLLAGFALRALPIPPPGTVHVTAIGATTLDASAAKPVAGPREGNDELLHDMLLHD